MDKRVKKNPDYWHDIIMGGCLTFIIMYFPGNFIFTKLDLEFLNICFLLFCLGIIIYYQWKDDNFDIIKTGLTKRENFELVENALTRLKWGYTTNSTEIKLTYNKYLLKFLDVTIIPRSKNIYINFKYHSTSRTGRLPFFFGISTFLKWRFKNSVI